MYAGGQRIAAFRPTAHIYAVGGIPLPWTERLLGSAHRISDKASAGLYWALNRNRVELTSFLGAVLFVLALVASVHPLARVRLKPCERHFYFQPPWRRAVVLIILPALLLATTNVQAAFVPGDVFYYYHTDHLGSSNIITDREGNVIQQYECKAYGEERYSANNALGHPEYNLTHRFTGQVLDEDTGLYFYNARYYDPELGRFTQADTIVPEPDDAQTLNRYSYCNNNPLKYIDPTGHLFWIALGAAASFALEAATVGMVVGAALGGVTAAITGGDISMGMTAGAVAGFISGFGIGFGGNFGQLALNTSYKLGAAGGGALFGAGGGAAAAAIQGGDVGLGAIIGGASGAVFGYLDPPTGEASWQVEGNSMKAEFSVNGPVPRHFGLSPSQASGAAAAVTAGSIGVLAEAAAQFGPAVQFAFEAQASGAGAGTIRIFQAAWWATQMHHINPVRLFGLGGNPAGATVALWAWLHQGFHHRMLNPALRAAAARGASLRVAMAQVYARAPWAAGRFVLSGVRMAGSGVATGLAWEGGWQVGYFVGSRPWFGGQSIHERLGDFFYEKFYAE